MNEKVLILSDLKAGHLNQSLAFCELKNLKYDIIELENISRFKKTLSYILDFFSIYINLFNLDTKLTNKYKAVISTGSLTYYANKYISKKYKIKSLAIMLPKGFRYSDFDYILASTHDIKESSNNIISMPLNLSINKPKNLLQRKEEKSLAIILGGDNSVFKMSKETIKELLDDVFTKFPKHLKYITTSRRTSKEIDDLLLDYKFDYEVIFSKNSKINPIPDFIEVCDELFISIDSTSMLSEARANSNANLHIIKLDSLKENTKFHVLAKNIEDMKERFDYMPYLEKVKI